MDLSSRKRKSNLEERSHFSNKKAKGKRKWSMPRKDATEARVIQPGDVGIWATCAMKKEAKSVGDLRVLFQEHASNLYGTTYADGADTDDDMADIEAEIKKEIHGIQKPVGGPLFTSVRLDTQCLLFFKTRPPVEPVSFVHSLCQEAANGVGRKRCPFVKRLTPITAIEKATKRGLDDVAQQVLAPYFHGPDQAGRKFAIRASIRNNKELTRDDVIKKVAAAVGPSHKVDLLGYDLLILVEIYKNTCGMSVVSSDFEKLKKFNLAELHDATEQDEQEKATCAAESK
ncbi:hypothetical protein CC78DRAFT_504431 [Lojkania enalia]|uniref:THUMP domain-containing protein n=1 Tax=Lojkania enalia TaxID=147567 RepID=A0A9P4JY01_9PLEO|nr:hypothetical protein CC78DRAFT_504431 [Didymosphaeria enalia]